jgi:hypothetical protein
MNIDAAAPLRGSGATTADFLDRWIYVLMAGLVLVTALAGFIPDSIGKLAEVEAGRRPPFPPILHVHAVLMGSWLMLLFAQTTLMATGRSALHKQLGLVSLVLAPAVVIAGFILVPTMYGMIWSAAQSPPPGAEAGVRDTLKFVTNILLFQVRVGILFPILVVLALHARRTDSGLHKRLMILAVILPLPAAIDRIHWLPSTLPASPISIELYTLLWIAPMFAWDLFRRGRVHRAYVIWFVLNLPFVVVANLLWNSPWWSETVPKLMRVGGH